MKQKTFILADTHFSHENIIRYEERPFKNASEMDQFMIRKWNETVSDNDLVLHLGDVGIFRAKQAEEILKQLNGRKILILGNHDAFSKTKWKNFGFDPQEYYFYKDYLLTHKPQNEVPLKIAVENELIKGNIHGHTHSKNQHLNKGLYKCCCVEFLGYKPILFDEFIDA